MPRETIEHTINLDDSDEIPTELSLQEEEIQPVENVDEPDVEVVVRDDDIPEADRGKKLVKTKPEEPSEEELAQYSEQVRQRIKQLSWRENNERRQREQAERDRDEAVRIAEILLREKRSAEKQASTFAEASVTSQRERVETALKSARQKLKDAMEVFDAEAMAEAQEEISSLAVQKERLAEWVPSGKNNAGQETETAVDSRQTQPVQSPQPRDTLAQEWARRNTWFHVDEDMTDYALRVDKALQSKGIHPILDSGEYYSQLNAAVRNKFPDRFQKTQSETTAGKPTKTVVAGASRSAPTGGRRKISLTESEIRTAQRLGITPEQYAREKGALRSE